MMQTSIQTPGIKALFAQYPALKARYELVRRMAGHMHPSQYDVSDICNLKCEGCLYFAGTDRSGTHEEISPDAIDRFFAGEAARGVNFAQLGGAEPALSRTKLKIIAKHIPRGLIFTNGTIPIDKAIRYRIHISIWGLDDEARILRKADSFKKALKLYAGDDRAIFVLTINRQNLNSILPVARICHLSGVKLSFSHFSPTEQYAAPHLSSDYMRVSSEGQSLALGSDDLVRAHDEIALAMATYPDTVVYSSAFNDWIHRPEGLYKLDERGVAMDCGSRVTDRYRHFRVDLNDGGNVKCCAPNLDCRTCRIYAQSLVTALHRFNPFSASGGDFAAWLEMYEFWAKLFLLDNDVAAGVESAVPDERVATGG